jgi:hypothetical protein
LKDSRAASDKALADRFAAYAKCAELVSGADNTSKDTDSWTGENLKNPGTCHNNCPPGTIGCSNTLGAGKVQIGSFSVGYDYKATAKNIYYDDALTTDSAKYIYSDIPNKPDEWNNCYDVRCTVPKNKFLRVYWECSACADCSSSETSSSSLSSDNPSSPSSEDPSSNASSDDSSSYYSSEVSSSSFSSSSAGEKIYACMCDGKNGAGRIVRAESRPPNTEGECASFCPASQRDKDGWCTKTDDFGTRSKVRNCKWELTDPPLN